MVKRPRVSLPHALTLEQRAVTILVLADQLLARRVHERSPDLGLRHVEWIESQPTPVIAALVFAFCYALAVIVLVGGVAVSRRPIAGALKATTPVALTPLGIIAGLLIAFLASRVWSNLDHANFYVAQEASAIRESVLLVDTLPEDTRTAVRTAVKQYLHFVETDDWPAMAEGRASLRRIPPGLTDAMKTMLSFTPAGHGHRRRCPFASSPSWSTIAPSVPVA